MLIFVPKTLFLPTCNYLHLILAQRYINLPASCQVYLLKLSVLLTSELLSSLCLAILVTNATIFLLSNHVEQQSIFCLFSIHLINFWHSLRYSRIWKKQQNLQKRRSDMAPLVLLASKKPRSHLNKAGLSTELGYILDYLTDMARAALLQLVMKKAVKMVNSVVRRLLKQTMD